jgi:hypothetical protein
MVNIRSGASVSQCGYHVAIDKLNASVQVPRLPAREQAVLEEERRQVLPNPEDIVLFPGASTNDVAATHVVLDALA